MLWYRADEKYDAEPVNSFPLSITRKLPLATMTLYSKVYPSLAEQKNSMKEAIK